MKKKLWNYDINGTGLIDLFRLKQTSPNVLFFSLFRFHKNPAAKIRYYFARIFWKKLPSYGFKNTLWIFRYFFIWPIFFRKALSVLGKAPYYKVQKLTGKTLVKQVIEQFYLAFFYSISPREYFMYEFYYKENKKRVPEYLMRINFKPLIYSFFDEVYMKNNNITELQSPDSKEFLYREGIKNNLPVIPIYAKVTEKDIIYYMDKSQILNQGDLFVKPEESKGGKQAQIWFKKDNHYVNKEGIEVSFDELIERLRNIKSKRWSDDFLIQGRMTNHKDIYFDTNALNTIRINTLQIGNDINIPFASFRFSIKKDSDVDNFHAGGKAAAILNLETGELGPASDMGFKDPGVWIESHPVNGVNIKGLILPYWQETKNLVIDAHKKIYDNRTLLGWDIAITNDGPVIVECNGWPDNELIQKPYNRPLGSMHGIRLISEKLEKNFKEYYF